MHRPTLEVRRQMREPCPNWCEVTVYHRHVQMATPDYQPWLPDVRDILLSALFGFGVVAGLVWWLTL